LKIKIYGADWCSDCVAAKDFLKSKGIKFNYIDITENQDAINILENINAGKRIIPTIDFDGKIYVNPGISKLSKIIKQ
tara:strand:+ start:497 stop:730 length:234 start_codon:yes stop_codon:yes gene_type:complete